jgi:D-amino-acid dehydrogenase
MHTLVLGGGVIGVTTAYFLAKEGHEVTVVEKCPDLGTDATGGNAGLIAPGHSFAWASPAAPRMLVESLRGQATAIRVKPRLDPRLVTWGVQFLRECTTKRAIANTSIKLRLARYSQQLMDDVAADESIDYDHVSSGAVYLHRTEEALRVGVEKMRVIEEHGLPLKVLDRHEVVALDPGLAGASKSFAGAIHVPTDASGNSQRFTEELAKRCTALGAEFRTGVTAQRFVVEGDRVTGVQTDAGLLTADTYVLATGVASPFLSKTAGQRLPIYPAKGYSLTVDVVDPKGAPTVGGVDEGTLVAWSRMGDRMRISSTAEFAGYSRDWKFSDFDNIYRTGKELFSGALDWDRARMRSCLRPMTPDGPPILGRGKQSNLWYNTGHGHMGWTMACGSSRIVADLMVGRRPELPTESMGVRAYRR